MRQPPAFSRGLSAFSACVLVLTGCGGHEPVVPPTPHPIEVRHDLEPLTERFPALAQPEAVSWVTWNSAVPEDRGVPGPTTYWIDAVVELAPATTTGLVRRYLPRPEGKVPDVREPLRAELPDGPYVTGADLDRAFTAPGLSVSAYLDPRTGVLVLSSTSL